jgi:hypothetical protein
MGRLGPAAGTSRNQDGPRGKFATRFRVGSPPLPADQRPRGSITSGPRCSSAQNGGSSLNPRRAGRRAPWPLACAARARAQQHPCSVNSGRVGNLQPPLGVLLRALRAYRRCQPPLTQRALVESHRGSALEDGGRWRRRGISHVRMTDTG